MCLHPFKGEQCKHYTEIFLLNFLNSSDEYACVGRCPKPAFALKRSHIPKAVYCCFVLVNHLLCVLSFLV